MFKRVGKEIKTWAKVLVVLEMIPVVLGAAALVIAAAMYDEDLLVVSILGAVMVILLGYFVARLSCIMLYAKGELVDRVTRIDEKLERIEMQRSAPAVAASYAPQSYAYAPPAPTPVYSAPVQTPPVPKAPVQPAPAATAPVAQESSLEEEYTVAAVQHPVSTPVYSAPVQNAPKEWICPNCGQRNNADGNWCRNCGTKRNA